jgi:copper homeostasis protein
MSIVKEVCVESFEEAFRACKAGATRIELCDNLTVGGTTPSRGTIKMCLDKIPEPIMVMIRPRGGDFCYSNEEFEIMQDDVLLCKELGVKGVVFGLLTTAAVIDEERTRLLVELSRPMEVTFHKAIDITEDIMKSLSSLKEIGVDRILTSGGKKTAIEGYSVLNEMIKQAEAQLSIIVAGKVNYENFDEVRKMIPNGEYHGRKLVEF